VIEIKDVRYLPYYSIPEASLYLGVAVSTLRAWIGRQSNFKLLIKPAQEDPLALSFINLIELYVLMAMRRKHNLGMIKVRNALTYVCNKYPSDHPLVEKSFETDGINLFLEKAGLLYNVSEHGQIAMHNVIKQYLERIDRDRKGNPIRFYLLSRRDKPDQPKLILIDPKISFGRPTVSEKSIPIDIIIERYAAGESIKELMSDYDCSQKEIEEALRVPISRQAA